MDDGIGRDGPHNGIELLPLPPALYASPRLWLRSGAVGLVRHVISERVIVNPRVDFKGTQIINIVWTDRDGDSRNGHHVLLGEAVRLAGHNGGQSAGDAYQGCHGPGRVRNGGRIPGIRLRARTARPVWSSIVNPEFCPV